ncbi:MAG: molecular chaperone DnaJ [Candidatus Puniceispirillum sp. TMED52]|nr:molecular chaperone DnaJ [SAR116 cluster bacterium]OUU48192.1 MAG: molecular chaperone DnaJ [Candidatus Puniceispirillum sp. TMED52]
MAKRDFYDVLGVNKDADGSAIKSAYRKLAMKYHPDRNPDDKSAEDKFREAAEAYDVLKDDQKRAAYDQFGHAAFDGQGGGGGGFSGFGGGGGGGFSDIFDDMFSEFMGGGRRGRRGQQSRKGADLRYDLEVTLEQAFDGDTQKISIPVPATCDTCAGSGAAKGSKPVTCNACGGHGKVRAQQGFFSVERTCPTCQGQGETISKPCGSCGGQGRVQKNKSLNVNIPKGVDTGTRIRLSGEGEAGLRGGPAGDLYIFINVKDHSLFSREGNNLFMTMPVPMVKVILGGSVDIPSLDGKMARITIDSGTQSGHRLRLRGKGMPGLQGRGRGDMYVDIHVETPINLSSRQKELLKEFDTAGKNQNPESDSFVKRIKKMFGES